MITVIILTYNEEINVRNALENMAGWAGENILLDSFSEDNTLEIARNFPVKIYQRKFDNYANQRNYAIKEIEKKNEWMLFLDADEVLTNELKLEIKRVIPTTNLDGFFLKRRFYFMGKWIKHGGYYPVKILRLFKWRKAECERHINEHIHISGNCGELKNDFIDNNRKTFYDWVEKHNKYSNFESLQFSRPSDNNANLFGNSTQRKLWVRDNIWNQILPPLFRPFIFFIYIYFIRMGFLDGKVGFIYHFMHGLVYRFMIDVKYIEKFKLTNIQK